MSEVVSTAALVPTAALGIVGGSGLYEISGLTDVDSVRLDTPFGAPSAAVVVGTLAGRRVAFLPRHGDGHRLTPGEIPARANMYALRSLGVGQVVAVSAVGSLAEKYAPGDLVVPDQLVDRTRGRSTSFFGGGIVGHVSMADPFCPRVRGDLLAAAAELSATVHDGATYLCMEGPQFSTRAESELYRSWGMGIIGMTAVPEAALAREAGLCYATLALVTDYDCWHADEAAVSAHLVAETMRRNVAAAGEVLRRLVRIADPHRECACRHALDAAVLTAPDAVTPAARQRLDLLFQPSAPPPTDPAASQ
jgi:5'-methylthioadenosine phosphorylase